MRRSLFLAGAVSAALASPCTWGLLTQLHAEKPRVADAVASFLDSLASSPSRGHGPTCGCGAYMPQPEPTCEAEPFCGLEPTCAAEPTCGVEPLCGAEPFCGVEVGGSAPPAFGSDAFAPRGRERHNAIRMRIQSHPPMNVDRTFAPVNRLPPAPTIPSVERDATPSPARPHRALSPFVREPEPPREPPVASTPLPVPEPMPEPVNEPMPVRTSDLEPTPEHMPIPVRSSEPEPMPEPMREREPAPEPARAPLPEPMPIPKNDPVQAAPLPRPMPKAETPSPAIEEPAAPAEEEAVPTEASLPEEAAPLPTPTVEPLPIAPSDFAPPAAKLTPEPRRMPPRPLSDSLPYDPTDPFADPPATKAPAPRATPTTEDRTPPKWPSGPGIPRFGGEEFAPVGTGVVVQPASGVAGRASAVRPALRIVPVNDLPLSPAR
ncbi:MAG TPA: hypothetical protein VGN57_16810 [Pirellulaceae bacterium]|jgi:hypothetical protein|nr:hypothetical protein [Pirellulaceae bacterium]